MVKVAINGLGRMGKLVLRAFVEDGLDAEIVLINDPVGTPEQHALLLEFDTVIHHEASVVLLSVERYFGTRR